MSMWCAATAIKHRFALAVLPQEVKPEFEVRALQIAIDGLADVVQECGARRDMAVQSDFLRHDPGKECHFL